jgi:type II secretory pathway pseudopilin PulG
MSETFFIILIIILIIVLIGFRKFATTIILIILGIILLIYISYFLNKVIKQRILQNAATLINPPGDYMQTSGIQCPDYWVNTGVDSNGNFVCKNSFNVQTNPAPQCNSSVMTFTPIAEGRTWQMGNPNGLSSYSDTDKYNFLTTSAAPNSITRCDWINKCGPNPRTQGIWQGVNELCNNPPTSS